MAKRLSAWWIPACAFLFAALLAHFAGPTLGATQLRAFMATTGLKKCEKCNKQTGAQDTQYSQTDIPGYVCTTAYPVNFATGENYYKAEDLSLRGMSGLSLARSYVTDPAMAEGSMGPAWKYGDFLRAFRNGTRIMIAAGAGPSVSFQDLGGTYAPEYDYVQTLVADTVNHLLVLTDAKGKQWRFFDFSGFWSAARQGRLKEFQDEAGNLTTFTYSSSPGPTLDKLLEVQQTDVNPSLINRLTFAYNLAGASIGLVSGVTLSRVTGGTPATVRHAAYSYATSSGPNGPAGALQRVVIGDGTTAFDTYYYRYNLPDAGGWVPLRVVVHPESYERLRAAVGGTDALVDSAPDSSVLPYANHAFQYDAQRRVIQESVQGKGCGCGTAGGTGVFLISYAEATHGSSGPNIWSRKTTVTHPDGNLEIVYTNEAGQTILSVFKESSTGLQWSTYFQYDASTRLLLKAEPSVNVVFSEANPSLVVSLPPSTGLVQTVEYYPTTDLPNGAVAGYVSAVKLKQGGGGTAIPVKGFKFTSRTGTNGTFYPLLSTTRYRNADGTGPQTTTYAYTWQGTGTRVLQKTTTHPVVPTAQNGSNAATSLAMQYDAFGRIVWMRDEDGFIEATEYDPQSGAVTKIIKDVNTTTATNEPAGWVTPSGGGLHLTRTLRVDALGRVTKSTDPLGSIIYFVYRDTEDETRVYAGWNAATNQPTVPTRLKRHDRIGHYEDELTMSAVPAVVAGEPTGTEPISQVQSLVREHLDSGARPYRIDSYFSFQGLPYSTSPSLGIQGTHFHRSELNYDVKGRSDRNVDWTGTVYRVVYDARDRVSSVWIGTDDVPTTGDWSPVNTAGTNLVKLSSREYDLGGVGDGTLTRDSQFTAVVTTLDTHYRYDFRGRLVNERRPDLVARRSTLDNLGRVTVEEEYADANADFVVAAAELRMKLEVKFDEKREIYQVVVHQVDPVTGTVGNRLTTNFWSNARGMRMKTRGPNGEFLKHMFDGIGRTTTTSSSYDAAETAYSAADDLTGDTVAEQVVRTFDAASNVIQETKYERTATSVKTGSLASSWAVADSRRSFVARWYDLAHRPTSIADYGTNNGSSFSRPATPPVPGASANILVKKTEYGPQGSLFRVTDNKGRILELTVDLLGRMTKSVENRVDGIAGAAELDTDRITEQVFDGAGRLSRIVATNPKGASVQTQTTLYAYGTGANSATPAIWRNDLPVAEIYPDSDDTFDPLGAAGAQLANGADAVYDRVEYTYDYASRPKTIQSQQGTLRTMNYDTAGRLQSDAVTTLGSGVNGNVRRIQYGFDSLSRVSTVTSYSAASGGSIRNQVRFTYDGWGNKTLCEQAHEGAVGVGTPAFQKTFADGAAAGEAKYVRHVSSTYPNGRALFRNYPAAGSLGERLSRVDNLAHDAAGTLKFSQYTYLGLGRTVKIAHPEVTGGLNLDYGTGTGHPAGWDRFGRVIDQKWADDAAFVKDQIQHGYDLTSRRTYRDNLTASGQDELYTMDGLDRVRISSRGNLDAAKTALTGTPAFQETWTTEATGNWRALVQASAGATTLNQTRTHNTANEVTTIAGTPNWGDGVLDRNGNMTRVPQPGAETGRWRLTYDAWNRLATVVRDSDAATIAQYKYDGLHRRTAKLLPNALNWDRTDYYYACEWQAVEERQAINVVGTVTVATQPKCQYVWDLRYPDALVLRDENKDGDSDCVDGTDERLYVTQDANFNVTALLSKAGAVLERIAYDTYGKARYHDAAWVSRPTSSYSLEVLFAGYRLDRESGMYLARHRSYHPTLGRWVQRDPAKYHDGANLYQYVKARPVDATDPLGLWMEDGHTEMTQAAMNQLNGQCENFTDCVLAWNLHADDFQSDGPLHGQGDVGDYVARNQEYKKELTNARMREDCTGVAKYAGYLFHMRQDVNSHRGISNWQHGMMHPSPDQAGSPNFDRRWQNGRNASHQFRDEHLEELQWGKTNCCCDCSKPGLGEVVGGYITSVPGGAVLLAGWLFGWIFEGSTDTEWSLDDLEAGGGSAPGLQDPGMRLLDTTKP